MIFSETHRTTSDGASLLFDRLEQAVLTTSTVLAEDPVNLSVESAYVAHYERNRVFDIV